MTPQWGLSKRPCPKCLMNLQVNCGTGSLAATHRQHLVICQRHTSPFSLHAWLLSQCWAHDGCLHRPTGEEVSYQSPNEWFIFLIGEGSRNLDEGQTMGQDEFDMCGQSFIHFSWFSLPEYLVKFSWIYFFFFWTVTSLSINQFIKDKAGCCMT